MLAYGLFCVATEIEKSQPVNIPDAAKRKKKKRTRATDSFTGTFDGNEADIIAKHIVQYMGQKSKDNTTPTAVSHVTFPSDLYKLTDEVLGQGAYAKVQGCINLQNGQEFAVKVSKDILLAAVEKATIKDILSL